MSNYVYRIQVSPNHQMTLDWITENFTSKTDYTIDEVKTPEMWRTIVDPEDFPLLMDSFRTIVSGQPDECECRLVERNGARQWIAIYGQPEWDEGRERVVGIIGEIRRITERKQAQEALKKRNEFVSNVFEALTHPFYVIDADDYSIKIANTAAHMGELSEMSTCYALTHGRSEPCGSADCVCPLKEVKRVKKPVVVEHVHYDKDGTPRIFEVYAYPVLDAERNVVQMIEYSLDITERKRMENQLRHLSNEIVAAQEVERKRIAAELHDGVIQTLSSIKFRMGSLKEKVSASRHTKELKSIENMESGLENAIGEVRRISKDLRPYILDDLGLVAALHSFCEEFRGRTGIDIAIDCSDLSERFSTDVELALYRIIQEALTNIEKHSGARCVKLSVAQSEPGLVVEIRDDGKGFDLEAVQRTRDKERRWGLVNMRERAGSLGGKMDIRTAPGKGTQIVVRIPVD